MTWEEVVEKYGKLELRFSSYYKYVFTYSVDAPDGAIISASFGGDVDDIYTARVNAEDRHPVKAAKDDFISIQVTKGGDELFSWYDVAW